MNFEKQFPVFKDQNNYAKTLSTIDNANKRCLVVENDGHLGYAGIIRQWFEQFKERYFSSFGAIDRTKKEYVKQHVIAVLEFGQEKGWDIERINKICSSLPLFQNDLGQRSVPPSKLANPQSTPPPGISFQETEKSHAIAQSILETALPTATETLQPLIVSETAETKQLPAATLQEKDQIRLPELTSISVQVITPDLFRADAADIPSKVSAKQPKRQKAATRVYRVAMGLFMAAGALLAIRQGFHARPFAFNGETTEVSTRVPTHSPFQNSPLDTTTLVPSSVTDVPLLSLSGLAADPQKSMVELTETSPEEGIKADTAFPTPADKAFPSPIGEEHSADSLVILENFLNDFLDDIAKELNAFDAKINGKNGREISESLIQEAKERIREEANQHKKIVTLAESTTDPTDEILRLAEELADKEQGLARLIKDPLLRSQHIRELAEQIQEAVTTQEEIAEENERLSKMKEQLKTALLIEADPIQLQARIERNAALEPALKTAGDACYEAWQVADRALLQLIKTKSIRKSVNIEITRRQELPQREEEARKQLVEVEEKLELAEKEKQRLFKNLENLEEESNKIIQKVGKARFETFMASYNAGRWTLGREHRANYHVVAYGDEPLERAMKDIEFIKGKKDEEAKAIREIEKEIGELSNQQTQFAAQPLEKVQKQLQEAKRQLKTATEKYKEANAAVDKIPYMLTSDQLKYRIRNLEGDIGRLEREQKGLPLHDIGDLERGIRELNDITKPLREVAEQKQQVAKCREALEAAVMISGFI